MTEIKVTRIKLDRQGYTPNGEYFGVGGSLYAVDFYYDNGRHSRSYTRTNEPYQAVRHGLAHLGKVLP